MLPAEMANVADRTRARVCQRNADGANPGDGEDNAGPEVLLPNNVDGDNPPIIPERGDDEPRDEYAFRVMQAVCPASNRIVQSNDKIHEGHIQGGEERKNEWGETEEEDDTDNSEYQDAPERPQI